MFELRKNQVEPVKIGIEHFKKNFPKASLMVEPVAFGKSIVIAHIAKGISGKTVVLQPSLELLEQNHEKFTKLGGNASIYSASAKEKEFGKITYATIGSVVSVATDFARLGYSNLIIDECFPYNTQVSVEGNCKRIGTLYKDFIRGRQLPKLKTYNENTKNFEFKEIQSVLKKGTKPLIKLQFSHRRLVECTENHLFLTITGWKEAKNLKFGEGIITSTQPKVSKSDFVQYNEDQVDLVSGGSLGDSYLDRKSTSYSSRMTCIHGIDQSSYAKWKAKLLFSKIKIVKNNGYSGKNAIKFTTPTFYTPNDIRRKEYLIDNLNLKQLAIIWMDDGNLNQVTQYYGKLYSCANSEMLVKKLQEKLVQLGITDIYVDSKRSSSTGNIYWCINIKKLGIQQLMDRISIYIHKSMDYKVPDIYKKYCGTYKWDCSNLPNLSVFIKLTKSHTKEVFDIQVEGNHNYIVCSDNCRKTRLSANGIVVHNCDRYPRRLDSMFGKFLKDSDIKKVLGFTATPFKLQTNSAGNWEKFSIQKMLTSRGGKKGGTNLFKDIIHITQIQDIIKDGFWTPLEYQVFDFNSSTLIYNSTKAEFTDESVSQVYEEENIRQKIIDKVAEIGSSRKSILVFVPSVAEALILQQLIPSSVAVWGDMPAKDRREAIEAFRTQKVQVAINVNVLSIGFDYSQIDCIILGRPTASLSLFYQQCGRGTRIHLLKKNCLIVDFSGNVAKFGKIEDLIFKKDSKWKLYGTGGSLLTDIPIHEIGQHTEEGEKQKLIQKEKLKLALAEGRVKVTFGKFTGKMVDETPEWWRTWVIKNFDFNEKTMPIKNEILRLKKY